METQTRRSLNPLMWVAGIAVIVFSVVGVAAMMGWIPASTSSPNEQFNLVPPKQSGNPAPRATSAPAQSDARTPAPAASRTTASATCAECGVIESIRELEALGEGTGIGVIGGAVVGGLLGNQVGGGSGKKIATVAGAVGGAVAGNEIEKRVKSSKSYEITVRLEDGSSRMIPEANPPSWRIGDRVKVINGAIQSNT
jgi:outer membrane lipoprotein SlyB